MEPILSGRVYAPGMTCVYEQLFAPVVTGTWMAHRWKNDFDGAPDRLVLHGDPDDLLARVFLGDIDSTAHLYAEPEVVRTSLGTQVEYEVLAVESRWLFYDRSLLDIRDWKRLEERIAPVLDRSVYFIDVSYPHLGRLADLALVRSLTREEVRRIEHRSTVRNRLLDLLAGFRQCIYVDVTALAANEGYRNVCVDQIEHLLPEFRATIGQQLLRDPEGATHQSNAATLDRLMARIANRQVDIEFVGGMHATTAFGEPLITLRLVIHSRDPLMCPTSIVVQWVSLTECTMDWSAFHVTDGVLHFKAPLASHFLVSYVQQLIGQKTIGNFLVQIIE